MKVKFAIIGIAAISLVFVLICGSYFLGTRQRGVVLTQSDVPALGFAPVIAEEEQEIAVINVNTATVEELMTLPGIGEKLAGTIVAYRTEHGDFVSVWELIAVEGIGDGKLEAIIPYITIE